MMNAEQQIDHVLNAVRTLIIHHFPWSLVIFPESCRSSDNMVTQQRLTSNIQHRTSNIQHRTLNIEQQAQHHVNAARGRFVNYEYGAAATFCALTTNNVIAVAAASSCLRWRLLVPSCGVDAFAANSSALTFIIHHSSFIIFPEPR